MNTLDTLNELNNKLGNVSDYAVAKKMGYRPQTISKWRCSKGIMDEKAREKAALLLNEDIGLHHFYRQLEIAERDNVASKIEYWKEAIKKLNSVAASIIVSIASLPLLSEILSAGYCILC